MAELTQGKQATLDELEAQCLQHYEELADKAHHWSNQVPQAIKFWFAHKRALEQTNAAEQAPLSATVEADDQADRAERCSLQGSTELNPASAAPHSVICQAPGERCLACAHYYGKTDKCEYAPHSEPQASPREAAMAELTREQIEECPECHGFGDVARMDTNVECPTCEGTGAAPNSEPQAQVNDGERNLNASPQATGATRQAVCEPARSEPHRSARDVADDYATPVCFESPPDVEEAVQLARRYDNESREGTPYLVSDMALLARAILKVTGRE